MNESINSGLLLCGALAPLWMLAGVVAVGNRYPGYSHRLQVMSELGARERPTTAIHPFINNYPIGILFALFGIGLINAFHGNNLLFASGVLLLLHGLSHIVAGIFPCDADLGINGSSTGQNVHGIASLIMYFSLLSACVLWVFADAEPWTGFRGYSLLSAAASLVSLGYMLRGLKSGKNLGLHQRVSFGIIAVWCAVFSLSLL